MEIFPEWTPVIIVVGVVLAVAWATLADRRRRRESTRDDDQAPEA